MIEKSGQEPEFTRLVDLAAERLGGKTLQCSDDFFAPSENLLKPGRGVFIEDKYTDRGKWMDGWESRRKRTPGYDWCIIRLGAPGVIRGFDIDTNHFLGNHPPHASVEACLADPDVSQHALQSAAVKWTEILPKVSLEPGSQNFFEIKNNDHWSHIQLNIFPDGGVARFRAYGVVYKEWNAVHDDDLVDLAATVNGGKAVLCNDMFFSHMQNLLMPGRGVNMGDGWETKRNRTPGNRDWVVIRLAKEGNIKKAIVDTHHFKGNYPDTCSIDGCNIEDENKLEGGQIEWQEILPKMKLEADREHVFEKEILNHGPYTHVRLNIFPDGGVSRLRLLGNLKK